MSARARLRLSPGGIAAGAILALLLLVALLSLVWLPADPNAASAQRIWLEPSLAHPLGTDGSGRDVAARLMAGTRVTAIVLLGTGALATAVGLALALLGGLGPRRIRETLAVAIDVLVAFPTVLLAMMLAAVFGSGIPIVIVSLGLAFGIGIGRVLRTELRQVAELDYVLAARAVGLSGGTILRRHLLPGVRPVLLVQLSLAMGLSVLAEASLSFLGFGAPPEVPSWGLMLADAQRVIQVHPIAALWPGLAITLVALACYLLGDALRDALDPTVGRRNARARNAAGAPRTPGASGLSESTGTETRS